MSAYASGVPGVRIAATRSVGDLMASRLSGFIQHGVVISSLVLLPTAAAAPSAAPRSGVVVIRNSSWPTVQVEIRLGSGSQCDLYAAHAVRTLKQGEAWAVVTDGVVCWRREANPGAQRLQWSAWQSRTVPSAGVDDVTL